MRVIIAVLVLGVVLAGCTGETDATETASAGACQAGTAQARGCGGKTPAEEPAPAATCTSGPQGPPAGEYALTSNDGTAAIPFQVSRHHILVPVRVNGSEPFDLILDTGMPFHGAILFTGPRVKEAGLKNTEGVRAVGCGDAGPVEIGTGVTLEFPGLTLSGQHVTVMPPPGDPETGRCRGADGIIGNSLFARFVVAIDYDTEIITLTEPDAYDYRGRGESLPLAMSPMSIPTVAAGIEIANGQVIPLEIVIDTGAMHALSLEIESHDGITIPGPSREFELGHTYFGAVTGHVARIEAIHLGDLTLRDVVTTFVSQAQPGLPPCGGNGNLGAAALGRFNVTFDYSRDRMILEPTERTDDPFEFTMTGANYARNDQGNLRVFSIVPDSPALEAGLEPGDILTAIDGRHVTGLEDDEIKELLQREGADVALRVSRGRESLNVSLRPRRIL